MILKYCDMFLKLKDLCDSSAFKEADINKDGTIFPKDFKDQLEKSKKYSVQEVHFLISCNQETNHEGKIDYVEFVEAYYDSAKAIGFNLAILFTNLSEHMPTDPRLARFEFNFRFNKPAISFSIIFKTRLTMSQLNVAQYINQCGETSGD